MLLSNVQMEKKICIVGAGLSGLSAIKSCLEEGLEPICFESRLGYNGCIMAGGLWNYKISKTEEIKGARAYESLITNVSKESSCFSDFPYPKEYTPFFGHTKLLEYLRNYASHFKLGKHIIYNTKVLNIEDQRSMPSAGKRRWKVSTRNVKTASEETLEFDSIIICVGANSKSKTPDIEGLSTFKGEVLHSCDFDRAEPFRGKKTVVIGFGNSGADIAIDISRVAAPVILSSRSGTWINPRACKRSLPHDMNGYSRFEIFLMSFWMARRKLNARINHNTLGIEPNTSPRSPASNVIVNDEIGEKIVSGKVILKPEIIRIVDNTVHFCDGTTGKADVIICSIGYSSHFPFISNDILPDDRSKLKLFEWMFPYEIAESSSIAVVGLVPGLSGSVIPPVECQTRYIAQIMSGVKSLPPVEEMRREFEKQRNTYKGEGEAFVFRGVPGFGYQDRVAKLGGFYPSIWKLLFRNPKLAITVYTTPFMSYQYRLVGRHQWSGATSRISNAVSNTLHAINKNYRREK